MRRAALLGALLLLAALAGPATASPQPTPVCRFCGGQFEAAAADTGVNATVASSEVVVAVDADGGATWTVRLGLANGTEAFASSPDRLEDAARSLLDGYRGLPEDASFIDARLEGHTAVLRYRDPDAARRHAGLLVVDYLHDRGGVPWYHVNADRFVVRGPEGTVVANDPESGTVTGGAVVWQGKGAGEWYEGTDLAGSPYVVFGPDRSAATRLRAAAAVALATWPIVADGVRRFLLVQTALFALALAAVVAAFGRWRPRPRVEGLAGVLAGLGLLGVAVPLVTHGPGWVAGPPLLALGLAGLGLAPAARARLREPRAQALAVAGLLVGCFVVLLGLHLALATEYTDPPAIALRATAIAFPLAAMVPVGGVLETSPDDVRPWYALAVLAFIVATATVVDLVDPPTGIGAGIFAIGLGVGAVAAPLVGSVGLALGRSLAGSRTSTG